jgi:hypothetical protein
MEMEQFPVQTKLRVKAAHTDGYLVTPTGMKKTAYRHNIFPTVNIFYN